MEKGLENKLDLKFGVRRTLLLGIDNQIEDYSPVFLAKFPNIYYTAHVDDALEGFNGKFISVFSLNHLNLLKTHFKDNSGYNYLFDSLIVNSYKNSFDIFIPNLHIL